MPFRTPRYLYARKAAVDEAILLAVVPIGPGESVSGVRGNIKAKSLPLRATSADTAITAANFRWLGSTGLLEWNAYMLYVPAGVVNSYSHTIGSKAWGNFAPPQAPHTKQDWDTFWERLTLSWGTDENNLYGSSTTDTATYDPVNNAWIRLRGGGESASTDDVDIGGTTDEPLRRPVEGTPGPVGIVRLWSHEDILTAEGIQSGFIGVSVLDNILSAGGVNDYTFSDNVQISEGDFPDIPGPGFLLLGVVRYSTAVSSQFDASYRPGSDVSPPTAQQKLDNDANRALAAFWGQDMTRVQSGITLGTDQVDDVLRSILFGGGQMDEGYEVSLGPIARGSTWIRDNDLVVSGKLTPTIATPYRVGGLIA